ncbi:MAG: NAD-dependent epimerase/dehydratase family protein [Fibrobacter sp.]|nr:NAD-dependent epimerase/dehydratase family protein [Fibrobacter sp.]
MKILLIGGTGTISMAISKLLLQKGHTLYLINRATRHQELQNFHEIQGSGALHHLGSFDDGEESIAKSIQNIEFDAVADFFAFEVSALERDYRLFKQKTKQFIFISSASAYQKPLSNYRITEGTPLANPYWKYSQNKIACEEYLTELYRTEQFPITIVRPSHTYDERSIPVGLHGGQGSYQVIARILENKPVLIHGDGTSLWTLTHNSDFAKAFIGLIGNPHAIGESVQITSDESLTWNQIYTCIANKLNKKLKAYYVSSKFLADIGPVDTLGNLIGDKANTVVFDNTKLKNLVPGISFTKRFDQGVEESIRHVFSHPELQKKDPKFDKWCDIVIETLEEAKTSVQNKLKTP